MSGWIDPIGPNVVALAEKIVEAMVATTDPDQLSSLAQGLAGLTEKVDPRLPAPVAEKIVEAMVTTTDFDRLSFLAQRRWILS